MNHFCFEFVVPCSSVIYSYVMKIARFKPFHVFHERPDLMDSVSIVNFDHLLVEPKYRKSMFT